MLCKELATAMEAQRPLRLGMLVCRLHCCLHFFNIFLVVQFFSLNKYFHRRTVLTAFSLVNSIIEDYKRRFECFDAKNNKYYLIR